MADIVIYGGTFNPLHNGHLDIIKLLAGDKNTKKLLLIPTLIPPHKEYVKCVEDIHRFNMCKIAAKGFPNVEPCDIELARKGKSYTVDTLHALQKVYKGETFSVVCGGDMLVSLDTWKNYDELLRLASFTALLRAGTDKAQFERAAEKITQNGGKVRIIDTELPRVSSTEIREKIKRSEDISNLVPKEICEYITANNLYK